MPFSKISNQVCVVRPNQHLVSFPPRHSHHHFGTWQHPLSLFSGTASLTPHSTELQPLQQHCQRLVPGSAQLEPHVPVEQLFCVLIWMNSVRILSQYPQTWSNDLVFSNFMQWPVYITRHVRSLQIYETALVWPIYCFFSFKWYAIHPEVVLNPLLRKMALRC